MSRNHLVQLKLPLELKHHKVYDLQLDHASLIGNPLKDPSVRHNYILSPLGKHQGLPVIFHLSGYFSTGFHNFTPKTLNKNFVEKIDCDVGRKKMPKALHVFVEASTYWGGSQFINSFGCGSYRDAIIKDLVPAVQKTFHLQKHEKYYCVMGGSSGGYGALSLISDKKSPFSIAYAVAPDSYFEASLLPELFHAAPELSKYKNWTVLKKAIDLGDIQDKKSFFGLVNCVAMAHCYSPKEAFQKDYLEFPIDLHTGELNKVLWKKWLQHDPVVFLKKRAANLKKKQVFLEVGKYDNFSLQFGSRQIAQILKENRVKHQYSEFAGNHFGLSQRKILFLRELATIWRDFV